MAAFNQGVPNDSGSNLYKSPLVRAVTDMGINPVYPQFHFVYTHGNCLVKSNDALSCWRIPDNTRLIWFSLVPLGRVSILGPVLVDFIYNVFNDEFLKPGITIDTDAKFIELIKTCKTKIYLELLEKILKIKNQVDNIVSKINTANEQIIRNTSILIEKKAETKQIEDEYVSKSQEIDVLEAEIAEPENNKKRKRTSQQESPEFKKKIIQGKKKDLEIILENFKRSLNETGEIELENKIAEHTISSNEPDLRDYLNYGRLLLEEPDKILECRIYNSGESAPQKYYTTDTDLLEEANGGKDWNIINITSPNPIYSNSLPRENKSGSDVPIPMFNRESLESGVETNIQEIVTMKPGLHIVVDSSCSSVFYEENEDQEITSASAIAKHNSQCGKGMPIDIGLSEAVRAIQSQNIPHFKELKDLFPDLFPAGGYRNKKQQTNIIKRSCKKCKKMKTKRRKYKSGKNKNKNKNKNKTKRKGKTKKKQSRQPK